MRIINGEPWLWDKHWRRLIHGAAVLGIDTSGLAEANIRRDLNERIRTSGLTSVKARITINDERNSPLWSAEHHDVSPSVSILTAPLREVPTRFRLGISPFPVNSRSPIAGMKTCNYLDQLLALRTAMAGGFDEAVRLNERGHLTSAAMANIFWLKDDRIYTPALSTGCLAGTTREFVCENLGASEVEADLEELNDAEALFLTSAGLGVVRIADLEGRELAPVDHDILSVVPA